MARIVIYYVMNNITFRHGFLSAVKNHDNAYLFNMTMHICCMYVPILHLSQIADCSESCLLDD